MFTSHLIHMATNKYAVQLTHCSPLTDYKRWPINDKHFFSFSGMGPAMTPRVSHIHLCILQGVQEMFCRKSYTHLYTGVSRGPLDVWFWIFVTFLSKALFSNPLSVSLLDTEHKLTMSCQFDNPPLMQIRFFASSIYGSCTNFPYRGGNEQSWADVTLAHLAGTGAFLPNLFPPHTPLHSPHLSPFDLSDDPNESDSVFFEAQSPNLYLLCKKIQ